MEALDSYIRATTQSLATKHNSAYNNKLYRNLIASKRIKQRAVEQADGSYLIKEYWDQIDSGRVHGHGLSLQRVAKEVRHAALGRCAKIDFKASSYAILTSLALAIDPNLRVESLKSYIQYRTQVRIRIANAIGISEEWMKTIFTSLGFGAEVKDNPFNSIRKKLGSEKFNLLVANQEFAYIKQDLDVVRDTILKSDQFKGNEFSVGAYKYSAIDSKTGSKRSRNQKLAWIYQAAERMALDIVIEHMPDNYSMLLPVHDCIYIKQRLSSSVLIELHFRLRKLFPLLSFEQEIIIPIHATQDHFKRDDGFAAEVAAHRARIAQEELDARGYKSQVAFVAEPPKVFDFRNETVHDYELRRKRQFLLDIEQHESAWAG